MNQMQAVEVVKPTPATDHPKTESFVVRMPADVAVWLKATAAFEQVSPEQFIAQATGSALRSAVEGVISCTGPDEWEKSGVAANAAQCVG